MTRLLAGTISLGFLLTGCDGGGGGTQTTAPAESTHAAPKAPAVSDPSPSASREAVPDFTPDPQVEALLAQWPPVDLMPATIDFGAVPLRTTVTRVVELTNTGAEAVRILESRSNCGCTMTDLSGTVIAAGETVSVDIHFDPEDQLGPRSAIVTLIFDGYQRPIRFPIRANAVQPG
jgi:hypothetical protein